MNDNTNKIKNVQRQHVHVDKLWFKFILSASAATVAETITYPLDLTKTRLQIQNSSQFGNVSQFTKTSHSAYRGVFRTALGIVNEEGILKLWQGVTPAIHRHIVYTGFRMTFYEWIRENMLQKDSNGKYSVWKAICGGLISGALAQLIASPTDLVKVQMQMEGRRRLEGKPIRYRSTWHAFSKIVAENGIAGLWKGWVPNVQRAALVSFGDLATYDTAKQAILKHTNLTDDSLTHALSSSCSGLISATLGTPADVIKTRIMNQPYQNGRGVTYQSSADCLVQTVRQEGFWALYKGFIPIWARMAPWSMTFWLTYEKLRSLCGTSPF